MAGDPERRGGLGGVPKGSPEEESLRALVRRTPREGAVPPPPPPPPDPAALARRAELDALIDEGRALLEQEPAAAHAKFEHAWLRDRNDPRVLAHYGLTLVLVEKDRDRGIGFCEEAVRRGPPNSERLINLARALVATRNKEQAVRALKKAQELQPDDPRVAQEFGALGLRRRPPFSLFPRSFFLNRWLGRLTWRLSRRARVQGTLPP